MCALPSFPTPRDREDLDLRGLICSLIHEYREGAAASRRDLNIVDEHPYAIINVDRAAVALALRTSLEAVANSALGSVVVVRLYSTDEELCIEFSDRGFHPRAADAPPSLSVTPSAIGIDGDPIFVRELLSANGAAMRLQRDSNGTILTIAFEHSA